MNRRGTSTWTLCCPECLEDLSAVDWRDADRDVVRADLATESFGLEDVECGRCKVVTRRVDMLLVKEDIRNYLEPGDLVA